jgi:hypothetical protein
MLQMPFALLSLPETNDWCMIKNGTANLILRLANLDGFHFIKNYTQGDLLSWEETLNEIKFPVFFKCKNSLATSLPGNLAFYLVAIKPEAPHFF